MFADRFDSLMNIADVSNSMLGRDISMSPSYIGRLRTGMRPLPQKHDYLPSICRYLAGHMKKEYQINALKTLTGIGEGPLKSIGSTALYLEKWLLRENEKSSATKKKGLPNSLQISSQAQASAKQLTKPAENESFFYGNPGKRQAVEQFFLRILQEPFPQTLLLFSDEDMAWLYEDPAFAATWMKLFTQVLMKGNKVKIIHTISRNMNEMVEAVTKWIPIYLTRMIEPYYYPRLRDGIFQRTLFIAPRTAAVISSSVQQKTTGMLNQLLTDPVALDALTLEYDNYFSLCRPLMRIYRENEWNDLQKVLREQESEDKDTCICSSIPPLFTLPQDLVNELSQEIGHEKIAACWEKSKSSFEKLIKEHTLYLFLPDPAMLSATSDSLQIPITGTYEQYDIRYSKEKYHKHLLYLKELENTYDKFHVLYRPVFPLDAIMYVKDETSLIMIKTKSPLVAFEISDKVMINAFWDYLMK